MQADSWTRRRRCAAVAVLALTLAGCGGGAPVGQDGAAPAPVDGGLHPDEPQAASSGSSLPVELVGTWSGADAQGLGSWTLVFGADGSFHESNTRRGVAIGGQAAVAGRRLYLQPDRADSQTVTWEVAGGALSLDGTVYRRAGEPGAAMPAGS